ncbi:MAG: arginine--tRNA ligase [Bacteroidota bacterium]|nr:arginine--tRNA ligase [Bacteroidota bacterium]
MVIQNFIRKKIDDFLKNNYSLNNVKYDVNVTKKEFEGDYTVVLFPLIPLLKRKPIEISDEIIEFLKSDENIVEKHNLIQGFLNITLTNQFLYNFFISSKNEIKQQKNLFLIEYSSPNTNKPLHLGHIRNILLGDSISRIFKYSGNEVHQTQIINDRGIHICKSMVAWLRYGDNSSPKIDSIKGDHYVGKYYVKYNQQFEIEVKELIKKGLSEDEAKKSAPIFIEAQEMLLKWESSDKEVLNLWNKLNSWVYEGFNETYKSLSVDFDSLYYESQTYLTGKEIVEQGLEKNIFFKKKDGSIWVDLSEQGLDQKILLRSDGTSVYITQDIGTAFLRYKDHPEMHGMIYTTGNEQDYHFNVLFEILKKLKYPWAKKLKHLSYGMVDLPSGKMKSREGSVVDADDLINQMIDKSKDISESLGKINDLSNEERAKLYRTIALGALKYHILKVDPKKRILFDPSESIDFNGNTGPFIQYTYARIQSLLSKGYGNLKNDTYTDFNLKEREIIKILDQFDSVLINAYNTLNPSLIANYTYDLVKQFNSFYQSYSIIGKRPVNSFRLALSKKVGDQIKLSMSLLGIDCPERM